MMHSGNGDRDRMRTALHRLDDAIYAEEQAMAAWMFARKVRGDAMIDVIAIIQMRLTGALTTEPMGL